MVKATIDLPERENRILNIVKGKYGFKNKGQALVFIIQEYEQNLEPEIRPSYIKEIGRIKKGKYHKFKDIDDLRKQIEG